jgi:hypothetical protein
MKSAIVASLAFAFTVVEVSSTRVAVIELGKTGAVRRTTTRNPETSVEGVASFWSALHSPGRKLQHAGMTVVPDLFNKVESGMVLGVSGSGVDLDSMPYVASLITEEGNHVCGHMDVPGSHADAFLEKVGDFETVEASSFVASAQRQASVPGLSAMKVSVDSTSTGAVDSQLRDLIQSLDEQATKSGKTIILHLVVEEEEGSERRRFLARRLNNDNNNNENANNNNNQNADNNNANNNNEQQSSGYYGYGYYNAFGEWVSHLFFPHNQFALQSSLILSINLGPRLRPTKACFKFNTSMLCCGHPLA